MGAKVYSWLGRGNDSAESAKLAFGVFVLAISGWYVALQIIACQLWDLLDRRVLGFVAICGRFSAQVSPRFASFTRHPDDGFKFLLLLWLGICLPGYFAYELFRAAYVGFDVRRVMLYNIIRIGPMYINFMNVYVLCHKEAHAGGNLFASPRLACAFNYWVGLFHGVLPGTFTCSHIYNHHKYDNSERDVYSTAFRPRNSFKAWLKYLSEWFGYASNLSSILAFLEEGRTHLAWRTCMGTIWFLCLFLLCSMVDFRFTLCTIGYAYAEGNILLAIVNWVWHAFIDPTDPSSDYVNSTTIVEGLNFTLNEEYHVVHHQYAGAHWTKYEELYAKHADGYLQAPPSTFYKVNLFELFAYIIQGDVKKLVELYYKPLQKISDEELAVLLLARLECHGPEIASMRGKGKSRRIREGSEKELVSSSEGVSEECQKKK